MKDSGASSTNRLIGDDRQKNDSADDRKLDGVGDVVNQHDGVADHLNQRRTDQDTENRPLTPSQGTPPQHGRSDGIELIKVAEVGWLGRARIEHKKQPRHTGQKSTEQIGSGFDPIDIDTTVTGCGFVAADGQQVAAPHRLSQQKAGSQGDQNQNDQRNRQSELLRDGNSAVTEKLPRGSLGTKADGTICQQSTGDAPIDKQATQRHQKRLQPDPGDQPAMQATRPDRKTQHRQQHQWYKKQLWDISYNL